MIGFQEEYEAQGDEILATHTTLEDFINFLEKEI